MSHPLRRATVSRWAPTEDTKELLSSIVTKIELHFDHEETVAGRKTSVFSHGTIYVRPDAGEARSTDPKSTQLTNKGPVLTQVFWHRPRVPYTRGVGRPGPDRPDLDRICSIKAT